MVAWFRFAGGERNRYMGLFTGEGGGVYFFFLFSFSWGTYLDNSSRMKACWAQAGS